MRRPLAKDSMKLAPIPLARASGLSLGTVLVLVAGYAFAAPPKSKFKPVYVATAPLQLTGTGKLTDKLPFAPVYVRTAALVVSGTGALQARAPFSPVRLTTSTLTVVGTGSLK